MTQVSWSKITIFRMPQGGIIMEWRQISICPERKTGRIEVAERSYFLKRVTNVTVFPAYTAEDVLDFYHKELFKAFSNRLCGLRDFDLKNRNLLNAIERVRWPIEDPRILGKLWVPISDRQLEFEKLEPFIHLDMFETFILEQQLLVLEFVDSETKLRLLKEVPKERQTELLEATTRTADEQEEKPETAE